MTEKFNNSSITEQFYQYMVDNDIKRLNIYDFMDSIRPEYDLSDEEFNKQMAYFYTDLNVDGRFVCVEDGSWMLKDDLTVEAVHSFVEPSISTYSLEEYEEEYEKDYDKDYEKSYEKDYDKEEDSNEDEENHLSIIEREHEADEDEDDFYEDYGTDKDLVTKYSTEDEYF